MRRTGAEWVTLTDADCLAAVRQLRAARRAARGAYRATRAADERLTELRNAESEAADELKRAERAFNELLDREFEPEPRAAS